MNGNVHVRFCSRAGMATSRLRQRRQVSGNPHSEGRERRTADTILGISPDRGRRGLPWADVSRQRFHPQLYLQA